MKKKNIVNLVRYYVEKNDMRFKEEAYEIVRDFTEMGDVEVAEYLMGLLSDANVFVPQCVNMETTFLKKVHPVSESLPLPDEIAEDIIGIVNAVGHNIGINKFLFEGPPGTGKTETVRHIARILEREFYEVDIASIVDSRLGQTSKNIISIFDEINSVSHPERLLVLFDEIDAIALDRTNERDMREMGRATTSVLRGLDELNQSTILVATTNLYEHFDKALVRRFDAVVDFDRYSKENLIEIGESIFNKYIIKFPHIHKDIRLVRKILGGVEVLPYPGELENLIKISLAFSDPHKENDYLIRLYKNLYKKDLNIFQLYEQGFTMREIAVLTGKSKSSVARMISDNEK